MPQLNPKPWFFIMLVSWIIILMLLLLKMTKHKSLNILTQKFNHKESNSWNWPWQ
uniref:ATP synthase complex subunit 8 n=1 Tax=Idiocranium cf. russeli BMNH 2008.409 TaxID=1415578 RepID=W5RHC3_9AMPH|nr:ATP synthase F0 subunit 8 [Idiocranium cf. russeli BMNH 2008.409]